MHLLKEESSNARVIETKYSYKSSPPWRGEIDG
jgi:hypothetical protein